MKWKRGTEQVDTAGVHRSPGPRTTFLVTKRNITSTVMRSGNQLSHSPPPTTIRCKTCKIALANTAWKNCDNCRRRRTESYHRWKKSTVAAAALQVGRMNLSSSPLYLRS